MNDERRGESGLGGHGPLDVQRSRTKRRGAIEAYLADLGLDVVVQGDWAVPRDVGGARPATATRSRPSSGTSTGRPFDITQEEFHRLSHVLIHADDAPDSAQAA